MRVFCTYLLFTCFFNLAAQERKLNKRSPHRASIYSALIPGAGQIYNKKYWKTPIILAGIGSAFYLATDNQKSILFIATRFFLEDLERLTFITMYTLKINLQR